MIIFDFVIRFIHSIFFNKKHLTTISDIIVHFTRAMLCMLNRTTTMMEHNCNEHDLFEHPEWLLKHYFENSGVCLSEREQNMLLVYLKTRCGEQTAQAYTCPVNRAMTMAEYKCSPESFIEGKNYDRLILHYAENSGAEKFAELRAKDKQECLRKETKKVKNNYN